VSRRTATLIDHRAVLRIAGPIVISNLSTPLLGLADTAVVGQIPDAAYIGAIAVGAMIFNFVYWGFGFLRMGTTGLTAQAHGAGDGDEVRAALGRALLIACVLGLVLILLQGAIRAAALALVHGSPEVEGLADRYFAIRIWSAPFTLANYALLGWFIGRQRAGTALVVQVFMNGLNIVLDVVFVLGFGWAVQGVAAGTLIAEVAAALLGLVLAGRELAKMGGAWDWALVKRPDRISRSLAVNRDIMLRTLCLIFVLSWFTAEGARAGDVILAANVVLMQFVSLSAYLLDAFAFAAEALVGKSVGGRSHAGLRDTVRLVTLWACGIALGLTSAFLVFGGLFVDALSTDPAVRTAARTYLPWAAVGPVASVACFLLDGIFIGATRTGEMRNAMALSLAIFLLVWWPLSSAFGNHGLWASLLLFYVARAVTLGRYYPRVTAAVT
jgi:MATE family, multidrug efflux pump